MSETADLELPQFDKAALDAILSGNQHAFMPSETFGNANAFDQSMLSYQVSEKDKTLAIFRPQAELDKVASREAGRPQYRMVPYIEIMQPGETSLKLVRPVTREDIARWPDEWRRFKDRQDNRPIGTPLDALFPFHPEIVLTLRANNVPNVEALARVSDAAIDAMPFGGREMKERAQKYLIAVSNPEGARMAARDEEHEKTKAQLAALAQQHKATLARMEHLESQLSVMKAGASVGPLAELPGATAQPGGVYVEDMGHSAPLGEEITEDEWEGGASHVAPVEKRAPGRPRKS